MAVKLNSDSFDIKKVLKEDGVYAYGFGHIAKAAMFDRELSCVAKGIYAYFCSFTNTKNIAYPKQTTILSDLGIDKKTYYKHFDQLLENGYVQIKKAESYKRKNVYVINEYVKKVKCDFSESNETESNFIVDGIKAYGYGTIPKLLMIDKRLTIKAKALMAFLLSLSGAGNRAFPKRDIICMHLGVAKNTYVSMMNELISCGYIKVMQRRTRGGSFAINDYHFEVNPVELVKEIAPKEANVENSADVEKNVETCGKVELNTENSQKSATEPCLENGLNSEFSPCRKNSPLLENGLNSEFSPCRKNSPLLDDHRVAKIPPYPCRKNSPHNNINSINNTVSHDTSILNPSYKVLSNRMPEGKKLIEVLHSISEYEYYTQFSDLFAKKHCKVVEILVEVFSTAMVEHKGNLIAASKLWSCFVHILNNDYKANKPCVDYIFDILCCFEQCRTMYNIEYPARYLRTLIIDRMLNDYDESILNRNLI